MSDTKVGKKDDGSVGSGSGLHSGSVSQILPISLLLSAPDKPKTLPKWIKCYRPISYVLYFLIAMYSIGYILYIAFTQAHPRMKIQFEPVIHFLEYNSYSMLSPLLCPVLMSVLTYHVIKRTQLPDGDFFGLLGVLLFFALVNIHDGYGVYRQIAHNQRDYDTTTSGIIDPPQQDLASRNGKHWQYAWSTRPSCAKKYVRDLIYQHEYDKTHTKKQLLVDFRKSNRGYQVIRSSQASAETCDRYNDLKSKAKARPWMKDLQSEFHCCGPYGAHKWVPWFEGKIERAGCNASWARNEGGDIKGCYQHLMMWLNDKFFTTFTIMLVQSGLYLVSIVLACIHYTAMRYEQSGVEKKYSLLDMSEKPVEHPEPILKQSDVVIEGVNTDV